MRWKPIPIPDPREAVKYKLAVRLNSLGSLYFFIKFTLQRHRLSDRLHKPILQRLENDQPRYLLEMPRDHFKSVLITEGRTMWRSLPFNEADEAASILMLFAPGAPREAYFEGFGALADMTDDERREWFIRHDNYWIQ